MLNSDEDLHINDLLLNGNVQDQRLKQIENLNNLGSVKINYIQHSLKPSLK